MTNFSQELRVNSTTAGDQENPSIATLSGGGHVVTWTSYGQDGSGAGVYAQRFSEAGAKLGGETRVNTTTANDQLNASAAALADGGFVVSWMSSTDEDGSDWNIYAQRYNSSGGKVGGETLVNTTTANSQVSPSVASLPDGYVIAWTSAVQDGSGQGIYAQRFTIGGTPDGEETQVNTTTAGFQQLASVAALSDGGYVVNWQSAGQDGSGLGVYGQRYDSDGSRVGGETRVNSRTTGDQGAPATAGLRDGHVVVWTSEDQDGSGAGLYLQRYNTLGAKVGGETRVNTTTAHDQRAADVAALADGGFIVTWTSFAQDGSNDGVYAQRFSGSGARVGGETLVNAQIENSQSGAAVAAHPDGRFVVSWTSLTQDGSGAGVYQRLSTAPVEPSIPDLLASSDSGQSSGDNLTNDTTPTFSGTAEAGSTVRLLDGSKTIGQAVADASGAWTITSATLARGAHSISATATATNGVVTESPAGLALTIDTVAPRSSKPDLTAASDTGASSTDNVTADDTPTFTGTAEAGATVTLRDGATTTIGSTIADAQGRWSITSLPLSDGSHRISAVASDPAGNVGAASSVLGLTIVSSSSGPASASNTAADAANDSADPATITLSGLLSAPRDVDDLLFG